MGSIYISCMLIIKTLLILLLLVNNSYGYENWQNNKTCNYQISKNLYFNTDNKVSINAKQQVILNDIYTYTDEVNLISKDINIKADKLILNNNTNKISIINNISLYNKDILVNADSANISKSDYSVVNIKNADYKFINKTINGNADNLLLQKNIALFTNATYSTCLGKDKAWFLESSEIDINLDNNKGIAKDVVIRFFGMPIFYTPKFSWILSGRKSGFLSPEFNSFDNSDTTNYQLILPYYFNLAPHKDLIIAINNITNIGSGINVNYRHLLINGKLDIASTYFNKDEINNQKRWLIHANTKLNISDNITAYGIINRISDNNFFNDIQNKTFNEKVLASHVKINYQKQDSNIYLLQESQQIVNQSSPSYVRAPELAIKNKFDFYNAKLTLGLNATNFVASNEAEYDKTIRSHYAASLNKNIWYLQYNIKPEFNIYHTIYNLEQDNKNRTITNFNITIKRSFNNLFSKQISYMLTPIVFYNYTYDKLQDDLPNFDSEIIQTNYQSLFINNPLTGIDRFIGANNITLGLNTDIINNANGDSYANISIAQAFYKKAKYNPNSDLRHSNVIISANNYFNNSNINFDLHYSPDDNDFVEKHISWDYNSSNGFVYIAHHNIQSDKYLELYTTKNIINNTNIFAGINYDIGNKIYNKRALGFAYDDCCWSFKMANFREYNGNNYNNSINIEFSLKGLFNSTPDFEEQINNAIPGYNDFKLKNN